MTNSKTTKRALLTSALSLLMCVAMLIGTTFAWFTDSASTSVNKIQAGTLDVALEMKENGEWVSAEGKTLNFVKAEGHESDEILWEPGCTYNLPELRITNKGNLALKYKLMITGIQGDAKLNEVIEWTISNGNAKLVGADNEQAFNNQEYYLLAGESDTLTIEGHMDELAGNEYQGLSIDGISITVVATQYTYENDSNNNQYDKDAQYDLDVWTGTTEDLTFDGAECHITSAAQFAKLMEETHDVNSVYAGKTFILDKDIDFAGRTIKGIGSYNANIEFTFDGNGHTVSNFVINSTSDYYAGLFNQFGGTVRNLTVKNAKVTGKAMVGAIAANGDGGAVIENCKVYDSVLVGEKKVGAVVGYIAGSTVKNCYAENCTVICADSREDQAAEVIGFVNTGCTTEDNTSKNVTVLKNATTVSTADELAAAIPNGDTVVLMNDIDAANAWTTASVSNKTISVYGNGYAVSNLNKPLINAYGCNVTVKDLTVKNSVISANAGQLGSGAILEKAEWCNVTMTDCHVINTKIASSVDTRYGFMVGYLIGGGEIKNCTVEGSEINVSAGSVGGIVGHEQRQSGYTDSLTIEGCSVTNTKLHSGDSSWRVGEILGTCAGGTSVIKNATTYRNTLSMTDLTAPGHDLYGRISGGNLTIDGVAAN